MVLDDYAGLTWSDIAAERGDGIVTAIRGYLSRHSAPPSVRLPEQEGEIAGISYRVRGAGEPLVLLPLDLSPGQWEPLIPALAADYCTITLGGALLGSVASLVPTATFRESGLLLLLGCARRRRAAGPR